LRRYKPKLWDRIAPLGSFSIGIVAHGCVSIGVVPMGVAAFASLAMA